jgi:hypothetical protein
VDPGNGDTLRVESIGDNNLTVSRQIRSGSGGGEITWSEPFTISKAYAREHCDLGYAPTWHTVEGRTVSAGIGLVNDSQTRRGLYVAMSPGSRRNEVYACPSAQEPAESMIGRPPAPDPEITRQRRLQAGRERPAPAASLDEQDPVTLRTRVVRRDDAELAAAESREQALSDADHLGALHAIWLDQCRADAHARYAQAVRQHAGPADGDEILKDTDMLWRTARAAEFAGLAGGDIIRRAISGRSFGGGPGAAPIRLSSLCSPAGSSARSPPSPPRGVLAPYSGALSPSRTRSPEPGVSHAPCPIALHNREHAKSAGRTPRGRRPWLTLSDRSTTLAWRASPPFGTPPAVHRAGAAAIQ